MTNGAGMDGFDVELREAITSGTLSTTLLTRAKAILKQTELPVRLAILGLPGSGKTSLINFLAGATVVPAGVRLPSMQLSYGAEPVIDCTLSNGSTRRISGLNMGKAAELNPIFLNVALPLPALAKVSMLEVVAEAAIDQQARALTWAAKRTDMALWCSATSFGTTEQDIWSIASEDMQDNAFMVLTKAGLQSNVSRQVQQLNAQHGYAFKRVLAVDALSAVAARQKDGAVDKEMLRASGGMTLISAILNNVEQRRADARNQAEVFLRQIDYKPTEAAEHDLPAAQITPDAQQKRPEPVLTAKAPVPKAPTQDASPIVVNVLKLTLESHMACAHAAAELDAQAKTLAQAVTQGQADNADILDSCMDTMGWLSDYLSSHGAANDPVMQELRDSSVDAHDLMQLIELETGDSMTTDALSLMVQIREEMQARLAA